MDTLDTALVSLCYNTQMSLETVYHMYLDRVCAMLDGHIVGEPVAIVYEIVVLLQQVVAFRLHLVYRVYILCYDRPDEVKAQDIARVLEVST